MKSLLVSLLLFISLSASSKNFVSRAEWDRPLETQVRLLMPTIYFSTITIIDDYHVAIRISITEVDLTRTWRALMEANCERAQWGLWRPWVYHWEFDIPPAAGMIHDFNVTLPYRTRWVTWGSSPEAVWDDEFYIYEFFPIN